MWIAIVVVGVIALGAFCVALGVSLGRYGDREDEYQYRHDVAEALNQLDGRVAAMEPTDDNDQPDDLGPLGNAGY